ncbi:MAG: hypothetical protein JWM14_990 [Chitinophagaceae bacterium]|nr:hypothetical protein [Chitinophagaceae bacterium]
MSYLILPLLILELCITIVKDPGEIISKRYLEVKDIIISKQNARLYAMPSQWGKFQEAYIQERRNKKLPAFDIVTWGSSRSSEIGAGLFPNESYFNCAIPGSNVLNYVSMYELYKTYNYIPRTVIINIDPWVFYRRTDALKDGQTYYIRDRNREFISNDNLIEYIEKGLADLHYPLRGLPSKKSWKTKMLSYIELLSPSYFQSSLKVIAKSPVASTSENYIPNYFVLRKDGSYTMYAPNAEEMKNIDSRALNFGRFARGDFYGDDCAEGENMKLFTSLLDRLREEHVRVILFISPVHPSLYAALEGYEKNLVEQKLNALVKEKGMLVIGSYNPNVYKLKAIADEPDFLDEYHISYKAMKTIFDYHKSEIEEYRSL